MSYQSNKPDGVSKEICAALRKVGCGVTQIKAASGRTGVADLLVSRARHWFVLELKTEKGKLSEKQENWILSQAAAVHVVRSVEEALQVVGIGQAISLPTPVPSHRAM